MAVNNSISQESGFVNSENLSTPVGQARNYAKILKMGENGTRGLVNLSENLPDGVDLGEAALAFNAIYNQGKSGKALSTAKNMELLSPDQRHYAYNLGIMDGALSSARAKKEGGYPPASAVQNSSSLTQRDATPAGAAADLSGENDAKVLQKDGKSDKIETTTTETSPKRKGRTVEERQEARKRQIEAARRGFSQLSPERQKYLKEKYSEYRNVIEQLEVGDKLISDNGDTIGEVVSISDGIVFIVGEDGFTEMILPDTFIADGVISFLDIGDGHFEKPDGTWIGGSKNNAIWQYKSSESYKINEAIRSGRELTEEESAFIEELDRELEKTPKYSGVTYRNISFDMEGQEAFDAFVAEHVEGGWIKYPAYTSTSKSKTGYLVDGKFTAHIEIYGENGHDISNGYGIEEEQEVLYERNSRFVVKTIKRDGNTVNIVLEEKGYGRKEIQGSNTGNTSRESGSSHTESNIGAVQQMQTSNSEKLVVQGAKERNTRRDSGQRGNLQGVRGEVNDTNLGEAALAFNAFYNQGKNGKAFSAAKNMELLSPEQRQYAYNLGIMDKALDGVRTKKAAAEPSEKNDGKVLQKDGVGDTIKENAKE